jgi:hypothetical protein
MEYTPLLILSSPQRGLYDLSQNSNFDNRDPQSLLKYQITSQDQPMQEGSLTPVLLMQILMQVSPETPLGSLIDIVTQDPPQSQETPFPLANHMILAKPEVSPPELFRRLQTSGPLSTPMDCSKNLAFQLLIMQVCKLLSPWTGVLPSINSAVTLILAIIPSLCNWNHLSGTLALSSPLNPPLSSYSLKCRKTHSFIQNWDGIILARNNQTIFYPNKANIPPCNHCLSQEPANVLFGWTCGADDFCRENRSPPITVW